MRFNVELGQCISYPGQQGTDAEDHLCRAHEKIILTMIKRMKQSNAINFLDYRSLTWHTVYVCTYVWSNTPESDYVRPRR